MKQRKYLLWAMHVSSSALLLMALQRPAASARAASRTDQKEAGARLFQSTGCEHCHGATGQGTEKGPDLSTIGKRWKRDRIQKQILEGGEGMPAFADVLQHDDVEALVEFLHSKRKAPKTKPSSTPSESVPTQ